jgi:ankyrin repeat protein
VDDWDDSALSWASEKGHAEVVKLLLEAGANVHADYDSALVWTSGNGHTNTVKLLEAAAAEADAVSSLRCGSPSTKSG